MQLTCINTITNPSTVTVRLDNILEKCQKLIEKLEIVLDEHLNLQDELSNQLIKWGSHLVLHKDINTDQVEKIKSIANQNLCKLEELLIPSWIDDIAQAAHIDVKVHVFAQKMLAWMKEAQPVFDYQTQSEIAKNLQTLNLSHLPPEVGLNIYKYLSDNQKKIEAARAERNAIANLKVTATPSLAEVKELIKAERLAILKLLEEQNQLFNLKLKLVEETQQLNKQQTDFRLKKLEGELKITQIQLESAEFKNSVNNGTILDLSRDNFKLNGQISNLKNELANDNGGCVIL